MQVRDRIPQGNFAPRNLNQFRHGEGGLEDETPGPFFWQQNAAGIVNCHTLFIEKHSRTFCPHLNAWKWSKKGATCHTQTQKPSHLMIQVYFNWTILSCSVCEAVKPFLQAARPGPYGFCHLCLMIWYMKMSNIVFCSGQHDNNDDDDEEASQ